MTPRLEAMHRYPVKGLSPEMLDAAELEVGAWFPADRLYAVENGPSGFDPVAPRHRPKTAFFMLMRHEALARLVTRYETATATLAIMEDGREAARGALGTPEGRAEIEGFLGGYMARTMGGVRHGAPRLLPAPRGHRFTDSPSGFVSIINRASVQAVEDLVGAPVDPLRFRANLALDGLPAWGELDLVGRTLAFPSGAQLTVTARTRRCAATNVDPATGLRDLEIPSTLMRALGHMDCGVYARIDHGGRIASGDRVRVMDEARAALPFA